MTTVHAPPQLIQWLPLAPKANVIVEVWL